MIDLTGQCVYVAGGSRGIGRAAALMAAAAGADVAVGYVRDDAAARHTVQAIEALGRRAVALKADVADEAAVQAAIAEAARVLGKLDGLVVSAGIYEGAALGEMSRELWDRVMTINLTGTFLVVKAAAAHLRRAGGGSIVIYTSVAGQSGSPNYSAYAASKAGQIIFMKSMAKELAADRIRVNCVAPAWTDTDMAKASIETLGKKNLDAEVPLGRIGRPEDVAGATVYLLSPLGAFITGTTVTVDGGKGMRG